MNVHNITHTLPCYTHCSCLHTFCTIPVMSNINEVVATHNITHSPCTTTCTTYRTVGNQCEVFIFASQKFCCPRVKQTNRVSIPGLLLYSSLQKRVSECAFEGYHWSYPKCYVNSDAWSRQRRKAESGSNCSRSQIHRSRKLKLWKFLKSEFWPISQKLPSIQYPACTTHSITFYVKDDPPVHSSNKL